jgi:HlyD family secretion protein
MMDKIIEDKRLIKPKHIKYIIITVVLIISTGFMIFGDKSSKYKISKEELNIESVFKGNFDDYIRVIGQVEPITTVFLDVEEGGKVEQKLIEEGTMVNKGDVILKLRNNELNLSIMNSESNLAYHSNELRNTLITMEQQKITNRQQLLRKQFEVERLKRTFTQNKSLYEQDLISKEEYLLSKESYELGIKDKELVEEKLKQDSIFRSNQKQQMNINLGNMQQNLKMVRKRLENLNVKAPVDGQLGLLNAEIGESINKGQRIGQINILSSYKIKAQINEHYIDRVRRGLVANLDRDNQKYKLKLVKVYPEVREGQFEIDLIFETKQPQNIRTGQTYYLNLQLGDTKESVQIARGGFFQSTGGQWVYVLNNKENEATKRVIKLGKQNPTFYEVIEGLKPGEKVITSSYDLFIDNDKLEIN